MTKTFHTHDNIGKAKYVVNFHDGVKTHRDGSAFFDLKIFHNKKKRDKFIGELRKRGYRETNSNPRRRNSGKKRGVTRKMARAALIASGSRMYRLRHKLRKRLGKRFRKSALYGLGWVRKAALMPKRRRK